MKDDLITSLVWASGFASLFTPLIWAMALAKGAGVDRDFQPFFGIVAGFSCFVGWGVLLMLLEERYRFPLASRLKPQWKGGSFLAVPLALGWAYGIGVLTLAVAK